MKTTRIDLPRLDVLIYAHDGRGLGHASRSIGIGMALRRIAPQLKVLFVSGCRFSQELIGDTTLDWLKLPSYETEVVEGKSKGITGRSGFTDSDLGELRGAQLRDIVALYRPRLVLADHSPQGKHRELLPVLESGAGRQAQWILGVRGVIGGVKQTISSLPIETYQKYYSQLLWYGDSTILGDQHLLELNQNYHCTPLECGYVSRLGEQSQMGRAQSNRENIVVSVPWLGEHSTAFVAALLDVCEQLGGSVGQWHLFIDQADSGLNQELKERLARLNTNAHCTVEAPGKGYGAALQDAKCAVIFGGYNSLVDVLYLQIPALVCLRDMRDREQQIHLQRLQEAIPNHFFVFEEKESSAALLQQLLEAALISSQGDSHSSFVAIQLSGAENAAGKMIDLLETVKEEL